MWDPAGVEFNAATAAADDDDEEAEDEVDVVVAVVPFSDTVDSAEWCDRLQKDDELDAHEDELHDEAVDPVDEVDDFADDKLRRFITTAAAADSASDWTFWSLSW